MSLKSWKSKLVLGLTLMILASVAGISYASYSAFYVAGNGNVGLGTDTPNVPLHIAYDNVNTGNSNGQVLIGPYSAHSEGLSIGYNSADHYGWMQSGHYGVAYYDLVLQRDQGNVGIRTDSPGSRLTVNDGDVEVITNTTYTSTQRGLILHAPDGHCARLTLNNNDTLAVTPITCP